MAITSMDTLAAALAAGQQFSFQKASITSVASFWYSLWGAAGIPGAGSLSIGNTTSGVVPTDQTAGAVNIVDFSGTGYLMDFMLCPNSAGVFTLYDRIWHAGSVSLTSLATTTFSGIPSFASRIPGSNYNVIEPWIEMQAACSATATTLTATYTNQAGATGKTASLDANLSSVPVNRMLPLRLAAGDFGVQQVTALTVGGTVATSGAVNVVLLRRLATFCAPTSSLPEWKFDAFKTGLAQVTQDACLAMMAFPPGTSTGTIFADFTVGNA